VARDEFAVGAAHTARGDRDAHVITPAVRWSRRRRGRGLRRPERRERLCGWACPEATPRCRCWTRFRSG